MKKICTLLLLLTLVGVMFACAKDKHELEMTENTHGHVSTGQTAFIDILNGSGTFFQERGASTEEVTLEQYCETFTEILPATLTKVALVDLEHDSIPEVILHIALGANSDCGVLVLHWENNQVWGYTFSNRQMEEIKADGTFLWSGSSSNFGIATATFSQGEYTYQNIVWVEEVDNLGRYYKGEAEITRNEFVAYISQHSSREDAHWIQYSDRGSLFE